MSDDFVADHHRRLGCVRVEPEPRQDVREVHARRTHPDADLAFAGRRIGARPHLEDVRRTVPRDDGLKHGTTQSTVRESAVGSQSPVAVGSRQSEPQVGSGKRGCFRPPSAGRPAPSVSQAPSASDGVPERTTRPRSSTRTQSAQRVHFLALVRHVNDRDAQLVAHPLQVRQDAPSQLHDRRQPTARRAAARRGPTSAPVPSATRWRSPPDSCDTPRSSSGSISSIDATVDSGEPLTVAAVRTARCAGRSYAGTAHVLWRRSRCGVVCRQVDCVERTRRARDR